MTHKHEFLGTTRSVVAPGQTQARLAEEAGRYSHLWAVVADRGFAESGALERVLADVPSDSVRIVGLVEQDPGLDEVETIWAAAQNHHAAGVIAVGGGSALCAGKAVAIRLTNDAPLSRYAGRDRLACLPAPCLAVPTTGGSGSEVSEVVVLHEPNDGPQIVIRGRGHAPVVAILDGQLLATLPPRPMILAALDALSHGFEALWSLSATRFTDALALAAVRQLRESLPRALDGDAEARQQLVEASAMANYACGSAELATVHALSSAPTVHLPHGYQTGVLLPHVGGWMTPALRPDVTAEIRQLDSLFDQIGFEPRFQPGELDDQARAAMVAAALESPLLANDPRQPEAADLHMILTSASVSSANSV